MANSVDPDQLASSGYLGSVGQGLSDIYVRISHGGHNLSTFYARKLKFSMQLTQT